MWVMVTPTSFTCHFSMKDNLEIGNGFPPQLKWSQIFSGNSYLLGNICYFQDSSLLIQTQGIEKQLIYRNTEQKQRLLKCRQKREWDSEEWLHLLGVFFPFLPESQLLRLPAWFPVHWTTLRTVYSKTKACAS